MKYDLADLSDRGRPDPQQFYIRGYVICFFAQLLVWLSSVMGENSLAVAKTFNVNHATVY